MKVGDVFKVNVKGADGKVTEVAITAESGLVVCDYDVEGLLLSKLDDVVKDTKPQCGFTFYIYKPGAKFKAKEDALRTAPVQTETFWRYVGTKQTVVYFDSGAEFLNDYSYREKVKKATEDASPWSFTLATDKVNTNFWKSILEVQDGVSPYDAIADMFNPLHAAMYGMACEPAAAYIHLRAASYVFEKGKFDAMVGRTPLLPKRGEQQKELKTLAIWRFPNKNDNTNANNTIWIPGDWGYIQNDLKDEQGNPKKPDLGWEGENIIYLGGCFKTDMDMETFAPGADFWGHVDVEIYGPKTKRLQQWIDTVDTFDKADNDNAIILDWRKSLAQPPAK